MNGERPFGNHQVFNTSGGCTYIVFVLMMCCVTLERSR